MSMRRIQAMKSMMAENNPMDKKRDKGKPKSWEASKSDRMMEGDLGAMTPPMGMKGPGPQPFGPPPSLTSKPSKKLPKKAKKNMTKNFSGGMY